MSQYSYFPFEQPKLTISGVGSWELGVALSEQLRQRSWEFGAGKLVYPEASALKPEF